MYTKMAIREAIRVRHFFCYLIPFTCRNNVAVSFQNTRKEGKVDFRSLKGRPLPLNTNTNVIHFKTILFYQMALNPNINGVCCFVGKGLFRLMKLGELVWKQSGFHKATKYEFTCVCWLNENM